MSFSYSVAIRTLGTAGEKYEKLVNSIMHQSIRPEKIVVVLPTGYQLPEYYIEHIEVVHCKKGMVTQRLAALDAIRSEYILFCDDDVEFEEHYVEKLADAFESGYDCAAGPLLDFFLPNKVKYWLAGFLGGACVMVRGRSHQYTRVLASGGWSYNRGIKTNEHLFYDADSFAWTNFCISREVMYEVRLEDEKWLDVNGYAAYDDQTMAYKLKCCGYKACIVSDAKYKHNDGKTSFQNMKLEPIYAHSRNHYIFWHRFLYSVTKNPVKKIWMRMAINYYMIMNSMNSYLLFLRGKYTKDMVAACLSGFKDAMKFVKTDEYHTLPSLVDKSKS